MTDDYKSIRVKVPYLKKSSSSEYNKWWFQFEAYAIHMGFDHLLVDKTPKEAPLTEKIGDYDADGKEISLTDEQKKFVKANQLACASFMQAFKYFETVEAVNWIHESKDKEWPSGKTWEVVKELQDEFAPHDIMGMVELRAELNRISIGKYEDPRKLFTQITEIETRYRRRCTELTNSDKLCAVIAKAPLQYTDTIQAVRARSLENYNAEPHWKDLRAQMHSRWKQMQTQHMSSKGSNRTRGTDVVFFAAQESRGKGNRYNNNRNKGKQCYSCGKKGHIKRDCPKLKSGNKTCSHCGKKGHGDADCWKKHPEKKPKWLKAKESDNSSTSSSESSSDEEVAGIVVDSELIFMGIEDDSFELLEEEYTQSETMSEVEELNRINQDLRAKIADLERKSTKQWREIRNCQNS